MKTITQMILAILLGTMLVSCGGTDTVINDTPVDTEAQESQVEANIPDPETEEESSMGSQGNEDETMEEVYEISGTNFAFSVDEITVQKGTQVTIEFESEDGFHDWVVDEFDAATEQVQTGGTTSVTFIADEAGEFEYYCSVGQHRANGMVGKLIVTE